jgi:hypothetical protein
MKTIWFISGFIFLCGFFVVAPIMTILHWKGADYAFIVAALFGLIFIPITLSHLYKKIK